MNRRIDVHQHLWTPGLVDALRSRRTPPYVVEGMLVTETEAPFLIPPENPATGSLGTSADRVVLAFSSPLGIEALPPEECAPLLRAWHEDVRTLPAEQQAWAVPCLSEPDLDALASLLDDRRFAGLQMPATALATPADLERVAPVLAVAEAADKPAFVHPGPSPRPPGAPEWWPAVVGYTVAMQTAWWSWYVAGRALLPRLRICFAAGGGLATVHHERLAARGGDALRVDGEVYVDTSSYASQGLDALVRVLGVDALVLGSDHPYASAADPRLGPAAEHAITVTNPRHLLDGRERSQR